MSCALYLIYTLDLPLLLHSSIHTPIQDRDCNKALVSTFVDDNIITIVDNIRKPGQKHESLQQIVIHNANLMDDYMRANQLAANQDKNQLMILSKHPDTKHSVVIPNPVKEIRHSPFMTVLGVKIEETLKWNTHLIIGQSSLISQLKSRVNSIKLLSKHTKTNFSKVLANGLFQGKLVYAMEVWAGAPAYVIKKLQSVQLSMARTVLGFRSRWWSTGKLLAKMNWLSVVDLIKLSICKLTHRILQTGKPELLSELMSTNEPTDPHNTRSKASSKLGPAPRNLGRTTTTKFNYRSKAYTMYNSLPGTITSISSKVRFSKWIKRYLKDPNHPPKEPPDPTT
jgi:hypothetical protein